MALAFDAFSRRATQGSGAGTYTWTHTPVGTPRAVIVIVHADDQESAMSVTDVSYGGVACATVSAGDGSPASRTAGEVASTWAFFLGASIPTGAQTVSWTTNSAFVTLGGVITLTGDADTEVVNSEDGGWNGLLANPSATLTLGGRTCLVILGFTSGHSVLTSITPLTGWTSRDEWDIGSQSAGWYTYDTVGSTDVTIGWTQASDDAAGLGIAVSEIVAGGATHPGWMQAGGWF